MTNIILIMTDQQRADSLGCFGNDAAKTPHLDALAERGAVFTEHMTPNQICSPSRSTLFSGLYPRHHGLVHNGIALGENQPLITHDLKKAGYRTHGIGKFHFQPILAPAEYDMPDSNAFWADPENQNWQGPFYGFDQVEILIGESAAATEGGHYANWLKGVAPHAAELYRPEHSPSPRPLDLDEVWTAAIPQELHYNSWITERSRAFLRDRKERGDTSPFFLFISYPDPHHPFSPPEPWDSLHDPDDMPGPQVKAGELAKMPDYIAGNELGADLSDGRASYVDFLLDPGAAREQGFMQTTDGFAESSMRQAIAHTYGMVSMIDDHVGRILAEVEELGLTEETLIIFTSDHGELLGDHGLLRKGATPYRQVLHIPMIMAGPDITSGPRGQLTSHLDLRATLLDYLGMKAEPNDGQSFANLLQDPVAAGPRRALHCEYHPRVVKEQYNQSLVTDDWRLTLYPGRADWGELFDRKADYHECDNRYFDPGYREIRDRLVAELRAEWGQAPDAGGEIIAVY